MQLNPLCSSPICLCILLAAWDHSGEFLHWVPAGSCWQCGVRLHSQSPWLNNLGFSWEYLQNPLVARIRHSAHVHSPWPLCTLSCSREFPNQYPPGTTHDLGSGPQHKFPIVLLGVCLSGTSPPPGEPENFQVLQMRDDPVDNSR